MSGRATLCIVGVILNVLAAGSGCSRSPTAVATSRAPEENPQTLYLQFFDAGSLQEVNDFHALPPGVRDHIYPNINPPFIVGGLSKTNALVAYQVGDYVPTYVADAYIFHNNRWIKVNSWGVPIQGSITLPQLLETIKQVDNPVMAQGLLGTLSQLNLSDPVSDLNRNLAQEKTFFVGLCEPPGHTPGVPPADEDLVHIPKHGLWCLPGSGDPVTTAQYAEAIEMARKYSSQYNAELLHRIHQGEVP